MLNCQSFLIKCIKITRTCVRSLRVVKSLKNDCQGTNQPDEGNSFMAIAMNRALILRV